MPQKTTLNEILKQVRTLNAPEKLSLVEMLIHMLQNEQVTPNTGKLSSLSGLGSEIWKGINIDHYIEEQRQW